MRNKYLLIILILILYGYSMFHGIISYQILGIQGVLISYGIVVFGVLIIFLYSFLRENISKGGKK